MRVFPGMLRSTLRAPNLADTVTIEDWRSLRLEIQVRFQSLHLVRPYLFVADVESL